MVQVEAAAAVVGAGGESAPGTRRLEETEVGAAVEAPANALPAREFLAQYQPIQLLPGAKFTADSDSESEEE